MQCQLFQFCLILNKSQFNFLYSHFQLQKLRLIVFTTISLSLKILRSFCDVENKKRSKPTTQCLVQ